jgi:hypothetical protein
MSEKKTSPSKYPSGVRSAVANRGVPPDSFLDELIAWAKDAPEDLFVENKNFDIYSVIKEKLGPWANIHHRKAGMVEAMRVHAGLESSWNWDEGVDITNETSMARITGQETGIFQVSYDSIYLGGPDHPLKTFAINEGLLTPRQFIDRMKKDHRVAMDYYARLVRVNIKWAGPLKRGEIVPWLKVEAVEELEDLLK